MPLSPERIARVIDQQARFVGIEPAAAAVAAGMDGGWLRKVERGQHWPCLQTLERIGEAIDLSAVDILVMADELDGEKQ